MPSDHTKALQYYKENQEQLVAKYNGKTLVLRDDQILDVKDSMAEAYDFAVKNYGIGNFSLQEVSPDSASYSSYIATPGVLL